MDITFQIEKQTITPLPAGRELIADCVQTVMCHFTFDSEWEGFTKTLVFSSESYGKPELHVQLAFNDPLPLPWELLRTGSLRLCVIGVCGQQRLTTKKMEPLPVFAAGVTAGQEPAAATPAYWQQVLMQVQELQPLRFERTVTVSCWQPSAAYVSLGFPYQAELSCPGVGAQMEAEVLFAPAEQYSGNFAAFCTEAPDKVILYAKRVPPAAVPVKVRVMQNG